VSALSHPNIVDITDFGTLEGQPSIVMEYLQGETLAARLARTRLLGEATAVHIAAQVASALGAAHERGLVHRDLKPDNIFLCQHEDYTDQVKVLDFGIAKLLGSEATKVGHRTQVGALLGTPAYMSPEQCLGDLALDHRSDIYSLGVVIYQMVTGQLPFLGDSLGRLIFGHVHEMPASPASINPALSPALDALVMRAIEK
jgi:serine/threonine protein kinase